MKKMKTFIYLKKKQLKEWYIKHKNKYDLNDKYRLITLKSIDILITGTLIWFAYRFRSSKLFVLEIVAYGLIAYLSQYYISWLIDKVKGKV
jgi:hypothetical protein